ncbi:hypothetical protein L207DRAFT_165078 [Hyaloscypha variabilis F]|uniref:Uncharacterized protein n=1 Tax=Hyaloscypha variabilis (strain UAMH 11265 / GT02V1 / F) TaxID=1149755 RepID=A0A2J6SAU0_HYAVF|nr:hypothetical protein L207DRAFT_165078 [Hyaloscypha variabilis F]
MVGCPECGSPSLDRAGTVGLGGTCDSASSRRWEDAGVWRRLRWLAFEFPLQSGWAAACFVGFLQGSFALPNFANLHPVTFARCCVSSSLLSPHSLGCLSPSRSLPIHVAH